MSDDDPAFPSAIAQIAELDVHSRVTERALKSSFDTMYEAADRYGVTESMYARREAPFVLHIGVASWFSAEERRWLIESFAGVSDQHGSTRQVVTRLAMYRSPVDFLESAHRDPTSTSSIADLINAALIRVRQLWDLRANHPDEAVGGSWVPFVSARSAEPDEAGGAFAP